MKNRYKLLLLLVLQQPVIAAAQEPNSTPQPAYRWYVGIQGGTPYGVSGFSSFGEDKTRAGYNVGALAGYRISPLLSAEFSAIFGRMNLSANSCCTDYFLGTDRMRYLSPVAGMGNYSYRDIQSSVFMQQYALRLHVDMLQLANPNFNKRWSITLSPAIYGVGTRATIRTSADKAEIYKTDGQFQFGVGADIGIGYQLTRQLGIRLMSGVNYVIGKQIDGLPDNDHSNENMIWNNNLALTWRFGPRKAAKRQYVAPRQAAIVQPAEQRAEPQPEAVVPQVEQPQPEVIVPQAEETQPEVVVPQPETPQPAAVVEVAEVAEVVVPQPAPEPAPAPAPKSAPQPQEVTAIQADKAVVSFQPTTTTFILFHKDNLAATQQIAAWLDADDADRVIVKVDSYNAKSKEAAWYQANHVKSYLIGLGKAKESDFKTTLHTQSAPNGENEVVITLYNKAATPNK